MTRWGFHAGGESTVTSVEDLSLPDAAQALHTWIVHAAPSLDVHAQAVRQLLVISPFIQDELVTARQQDALPGLLAFKDPADPPTWRNCLTPVRFSPEAMLVAGAVIGIRSRNRKYLHDSSAAVANLDRQMLEVQVPGELQGREWPFSYLVAIGPFNIRIAIEKALARS